MIDWTPHPRPQAGVDARQLDRAVQLVHARGVAAQLCVLRDGQVIADVAIGCRPDALFLIFSAGKPLVALLVHLLAERGRLSLDDRVARWWPEFGQGGKDGITIRQVLQHRGGLPVARNLVRDALAAADWATAVHHIEQARPKWPPGQVPAYHVLSYGFILGEIVRRVSGAAVPDFLHREFLAPLGLRGIHLGRPGSGPGGVPVRGRGPASRITAAFFNRAAVRQAVIPAAGVSATARDLACFYQVLLQGGTDGDARILQPTTIEEARRPSSDGELDRFLHIPVRWSQGFQLGGSGAAAPGRGHDPAMSSPLGRLSGPHTFGHNGSNCCLAWADPERRLVFAYLTDLLSPGLEGARHQGQVSDAIIAACA